MSRLALWSRRLALFALVTAVFGTLIVRADLLQIVPALATVAGALVLADVAILFALGAFVVIWRDGLSGLGSAVAGFLIGAALLAYPGYLAIKAYHLPVLNDITTDTSNPPQFGALALMQPPGANPLQYPGKAAAEKQLKAYPDVAPLMLSVSPHTAFDLIMRVIRKRRWTVVEDRAPVSGRRDGHIEAVARTPIMGFRDNVVVRIRPERDGTRVDVRSVSRYGRVDFGTNAARIVALLNDVDIAADALPNGGSQGR